MEETLVSFFQQVGPVKGALVATLFTWFVTAAGAAPVFFIRNLRQGLMNAMLGLAAGVGQLFFVFGGIGG